jgi:hypothetical protein
MNDPIQPSPVRLESVLPITVVSAFLFCLFAVCQHSDVLLGPAIEESGDFALNGLQIENANRFHELHGNYSRWGFNHPGPAFFYVYAAGEQLFYRWTGLVNSPHQAHILAGIALQASFLGLGIAGLSLLSKFRWPMLFIAVMMLHFAIAGRSIACVWMPNALLAPTFALYPLAASIAMGFTALLPAFLVTCGFLLAGHVAQPLFVLPIASVSLSLWGIRLFKEKSFTRLTGPMVASVAVVLVFAIPAFFDVIRGNESNISRIWSFLMRSSEDQKTWWQAVAYFSTFFMYDPVPEKTLATLQFNEFTQAVLRSALIATLSVSFVVLAWIKNGHAQTESKCLGLLLLFGFVLCIQWGRMQSGEMYAYNSFFFYSLIILTVSPVVLAVDMRGARMFGKLWLILPVGIAALAYNLTAPLDSVLQGYKVLTPNLQSLLKHQESPDVVRLTFRHEDWPRAAAVALALARSSVAFEVDEGWGFMFGRDREKADNASAADKQWEVQGPVTRSSNAEELVPQSGLYIDTLDSVIVPSSQSHPGSIKSKLTQNAHGA